MNEPAIFYTEDRLKEVLDKTRSTHKDRNLDMNEFGEIDCSGGTVSVNNTEDYTRILSQHPREKRYHHDRVHNLFGYNMTRAAGEAFERLEPDKRILMFSRSSYIGMHRYGGIWHGRQQILVVSYPAEPSYAAVPEHVRFPVYRS